MRFWHFSSLSSFCSSTRDSPDGCFAGALGTVSRGVGAVKGTLGAAAGAALTACGFCSPLPHPKPQTTTRDAIVSCLPTFHLLLVCPAYTHRPATPQAPASIERLCPRQ